jgi:hypothetical protein
MDTEYVKRANNIEQLQVAAGRFKPHSAVALKIVANHKAICNRQMQAIFNIHMMKTVANHYRCTSGRCKLHSSDMLKQM